MQLMSTVLDPYTAVLTVSTHCCQVRLAVQVELGPRIPALLPDTVSDIVELVALLTKTFGFK